MFQQIMAFRPSRLDLIFAIKTFIAMMLALYIAFSLDLIYPMWAAGTVIIIAQPFSGMVSSKAIYRLAGTVIGGVVAIFLTPKFIDMPILFTFVLAAWVGFCLYISLLDRTPRSYLFMLAGYTTVMITCSSIYNIASHSVFDMALSRVLEISIAVICSAVVSATIFPAHLGKQLQQRLVRTMADVEKVFDQILTDPGHNGNYTQLLSGIARDSSDIHGLAVHLAYERGELQGMTKPLQEMLHQMSMVVANLVAMSERIAQLEEKDPVYREALLPLHAHVVGYLKSQTEIDEQDLNQLPNEYVADFERIRQHLAPEQYVVLAALKMDVRHFIANLMAVKLLWSNIQKGQKRIPKQIARLTTYYPSLHRDHGVAVLSSIAAFVAILISFLFWIYSGWQAGYLMAQLTAITACILATLDNPIPALKMFVRGSMVAAVLVIFYAFTLMPQVHSFWQLALVLAPLTIYFASMFPRPALFGLALPILINFVVSLNLQNRYATDAVLLMDSAMAGIVGPLISILAIYFIRAMSPEASAKRILALHYRDMREVLFIPYGVTFRVHLRRMLDRIGVLNTKLVQSDELKRAMNYALIETSAVVNLSRIAELKDHPETFNEIRLALDQLQELLKQGFREQEKKLKLNSLLQTEIMKKIDEVKFLSKQETNHEIEQRILISMNNIESSLLHCKSEFGQDGASHGRV